MASSPRDAEREEERRFNMRTLTIASAASATAAAVTSQLWIAGTWIAAALTPVLVTLISEALHRPTERVARAWTSERTALGAPGSARAADAPLPEAAGASPPPPPGGDALPRRAAPEPGPVRVYRQSRARPTRRHIALGAVAATAALAFVIGIVALTTVDLVSGGSVGKGSGRSTLFGGNGNDSGNGDRTGDAKDSKPATGDGQGEAPADAPADEPDQGEPAPEEPPQEEPSDTAPVPAPTSPAPGEPAPQTVP
jgi:hypothetical protein